MSHFGTSAGYGEGLTVSSVHTGVVRFASDADATRMFATFIDPVACLRQHHREGAHHPHLRPAVEGHRRFSGRRRSCPSVVLSGETGDQPAFPTEHAVGLTGDCIVDVDVAVTDAVPARRVATTRAVDLVRVMLENIRRTR